MSNTPRIISLDTETHGVLRGNTQNHFHPIRSLRQDGIPLFSQLINIAITVPEYDPRTPATTRKTGANRFLPSDPSPWSLSTLAQLKPGRSFHLDPSSPSDINLLIEWLKHADTILGMNIQYDLLHLRRCIPRLRPYLTPSTHTLLDLQVIMYHESEIRPERSLKDIGLVLGTHRYEYSAKDQFDSPAQSAVYCCEDTHNTLLPISSLCQRIRDRYPDTSKLNPWAIDHYSSAIWECIVRSENGVPFSYPKLLSLADEQLTKIRDCEQALAEMGVQISGPGCKKNQADYLDELLSVVLTPATPDTPEETLGDRLSSHPLLTRTPKKREISLSRINRNLFLIELPPEETHHRRILELWETHTKAQKIYSTYCFSMLWHQRNKPSNTRSALIPLSPRYRVPAPGTTKAIPQSTSLSRIGLAYPSWFIVPSAIKDGEGMDGGTKQVRETCKGPALQTNPKEITRCIESRWSREGGRIVSYDMSQAELRTAAVLSGDETLVSAYNDDLDLHGDLAAFCEGEEIRNHPYFKTGSNILDPRQHYKQANFLILYRGNAHKLAQTLLLKCGVVKPIPWCKSVVEGLRTLRSGLWNWQSEIIAQAHKDGYLELPFIGVSRIFAGGDKFDENEIVNLPVQGLAALTQARFQILVSQRLGFPSILENAPILPLLNVFDSIKFDVRSESEEQRLDEIVKDAHDELTSTDIWGMLQDRFGRKVPLIIEKES